MQKAATFTTRSAESDSKNKSPLAGTEISSPRKKSKKPTLSVSGFSPQDQRDASRLGSFLYLAGFDNEVSLEQAARFALALNLFTDKWSERTLWKPLVKFVGSFHLQIFQKHLFYISGKGKDRKVTVVYLPAPGMPRTWTPEFCAEVWIESHERRQQWKSENTAQFLV